MRKKIGIITICIVLCLVIFIGDADATWWNSTYMNCKNITITNNNGYNLNNFPIWLNLSFPTNQSDYSDLRFVDTYCNNSGNQLYHWSENYTSSYDLEFVNVTSIPTTGTIISVYYNSISNSDSNGNMTFLWFDNFSTNRTSYYTIYSSGAILGVGGGYLNVTSSGNEQQIWLKTTNFTNSIVGIKGRILSASGNRQLGVISRSVDSLAFDVANLEAAQYSLYPVGFTGTRVNSPQIYDVLPWRIFHLQTNVSTSLVVLNATFINSSTMIQLGTTETSTTGTTLMPNGIYVYGGGYIYQFDDFFIGNHTYPEPTYLTGITTEFNPPVTNLWLNNIQGNISCTYPCTVNATAIINVAGLTVSIYKNGTLIANGTDTTYNITEWSAGIYNITASYPGNSFHAPSSVTYYATISQLPSSISLISSGGWNIPQGTQTTIVCSGVGNPVLHINGILISSPYTALLPIGSHSVTCDVADTENYTYSSSTHNLLVSLLISCLDSDTFGFFKNFTVTENITTLDFTGIVLQDYVKDDLSDVFVNITNYASDVWKNATGGYYIIVNTTGLSHIDIYFGNYIANYSYNYSSLTNATVVTNYSQINPSILINIVDEMTGNSLYPPASEMYLIPTCSLGSDYIQIYNFTNVSTKVFIPGKTSYDTIALRVKYTADMYYSRQIITSGTTYGSINIYVVDAYLNALDRIDFHMIDSVNYNARFQIYKLIQSTPVIITEGYFDASHYFSGYLMEDTEYHLRTILNGAYTDYGTMNVVTPATKDLSIGKISLNPDALLIADHIKMNAFWSYNKTIINIEYADDTNQTQQLNITVEFANGTVFQMANYTNTSNIILTYNVTNYPNDEFYIKLSIHHSIFGNSPVEFGLALLRDFSSYMNKIPAVWKQLLSIFFVLMAQGIVTRRNLLFGTILTIALMVMMWAIGWLQTSFAFMTMAFVLGIIGIVAYHKQGGE